MFIDEYFVQIEAWIAASPYVLSWNLLKDKRSQTIGFLRGRVELSDGSQLHDHKHIGPEPGTVVESSTPTLAEVLHEIEAVISEPSPT